MDELDAKLARLGDRVRDREETRRAQVRAAIALEPGLGELLELTRERFGAKLTWLRAGDFEQGRELPRGVRPAPAFVVKGRRRV